MRRTIFLSSGVLAAGMAAGLLTGMAQPRRAMAQEAQEAEKPIPPEDVAKKNPVKPTPEGLAAAKKLYGYHCAMCHGTQGDGKGDLAADMKLKLPDWRDPKSLEKMTDGELFYIITNGRGKMTGGEGDRTSEEMRWNLVNYVRAFSKKDAGISKQ
jgi:mono/diheme cytochrome c family protein